MKNPFARKKLSDSTSPRASVWGGNRGGKRTTDRNTKSFTDDVSPTLQYSWANDPEIVKKYSWVLEPEPQRQPKDGKGKPRKVGKLVKQLNCAAASKHMAELEMENVKARKQRRGEREPLKWRRTGTEDYGARTVMITVKNTDSPPRGTGGGIGGRRSILCPGMTPSSIPDHNFSAACAQVYDPEFGPHRSGTRSYTKLKPSADGINSHKELAARKERWLKGLKHGWEEDGSRSQPYTLSGDSSAYGCAPVAGSGESIGTDYTTENSSEDSDSHVRPRPTKHVMSSPARRKATSARVSGIRGCHTGGLWEVVAEDMGIIAGMLISDGSACVGSVTEIAKETMADSCRAKPVGV